MCDVPWIGMSIVQANGQVNFCCYSSEVVGNVNDSRFEEIWNGHIMQRIRRELTAGRLPQACRSTACPIFRGDAHSHLLDRMEGRDGLARTEAADARNQIRLALEGSELSVRRGQGTNGDQLAAVIQLTSAPTSLSADLFVCLRGPDGAIRFLPSLDDYPVPVETSLVLAETPGNIRIPVCDGPVEGLTAGAYEICAALFEVDSNPTLLSNCYWAARVIVTL